MSARYFRSAALFRAWLAAHHATATELVVGFHKVGSGRPSLTWSESVDEALCYGWIDGIRRSVDETRYTIRFTPRRRTSTWSVVNIRRVGELERLGRMRAAGRAAFEARRENRSGLYSFEQRRAALDPSGEAAMRRNKKAWAYWQAEAPSYRKAASWWVLSAKKPETRARRLAQLIADCAAGLRIKAMRRPTR